MIEWRYVAAAARISGYAVSRERRGPPPSDSVGISRTAPPLQGPENPGHGRLFRIGARRTARARRTRSENVASARRQRRPRAVPGRARAVAHARRMGRLLRGRARSGTPVDELESVARIGKPSLRGRVG